MQLLDRHVQRDLLNTLGERYPNPVTDLFDPVDLECPASVNLHYLEEHGLVTLERVERARHPSQHRPGIARWHGPTLKGSATITAAGMDFLSDDGGLSAILGTVTVRLHADSIRDLIETRIIASDQVPEDEKPGLIAALKGMREEGLKQLTTRLITYGLDQGAASSQQLIQWLTTS
ncbi:hypothetical protein FIU83_06340 [Halomonas sp. THAF5a]|uniref:hypothetical protein n=1 Tax=Halomonas sp. THAF5a TaxID=2587844 RepID=UPI00126818BF|nr:hypothetical protein [Halomonas sp. THAF5a]QFU01254.1 hypothetical protein FIU83_06340 [Halomonas sp. THAF5a]